MPPTTASRSTAATRRSPTARRAASRIRLDANFDRGTIVGALSDFTGTGAPGSLDVGGGRVDIVGGVIDGPNNVFDATLDGSVTVDGSDREVAGIIVGGFYGNGGGADATAGSIAIDPIDGLGAFSGEFAADGTSFIGAASGSASGVEGVDVGGAIGSSAGDD